MKNVLLVQELVNGYGRKHLSPRCAIKIDRRKAFDSIDWSFLFDMLVTLNFPAQFIRWIDGCITTPKFSISINGGLMGYFEGQKGLRQGDPLSPCLFVIVMEVLSQMLNVAASRKFFDFHPKCKRIGLSHLVFADDLLIFTKGNLSSVLGVKKVLDLFL